MTSPFVLKTVFFELLAFAVGFEIFADVFFKRWSIDSRPLFFTLGWRSIL